jgi:hypothetical protein
VLQEKEFRVRATRGHGVKDVMGLNRTNTKGCGTQLLPLGHPPTICPIDFSVTREVGFVKRSGFIMTEPSAKKYWGTMSLSDLLMVISTIVIAIATVFNVGVACLMWNEMRAGGVDTHNLAVAAGKQADAAKATADASKSQADNSAKEIVVAGKQAKAAQDSVKAIREQTRLNEQAWIGTSDPKMIGSPPQFAIIIKNYGRSPARSVEAFIYGEIRPSEAPIDYDLVSKLQKTNLHGVALLVPGEPFTLITSKVVQQQLKSNFLDGLRNGSEQARMMGRIEYRDILGQPHYTTFCKIFWPDLTNARSCPDERGEDAR